jgi:phosphoglycerol transferase MdoB-like AlkP superfamily enzyme
MLMTRLHPIIQQNVRYLLPLLFSLWMIRSYEYAFVELAGESAAKYSYLLSGMLLDTVLSLILFTLSVFLQFCIGLAKIKTNFIFPSLSILFITIDLSLVHYFDIAKIPLDETILFFTWDEIRMISDRGGKIPTSFYLSYLLLTSLFFVLQWLLRKLTLSKWSGISLLLLTIIVTPFLSFTFYESEKKVAEVYVNNRLIYFVGKVYRKWQSEWDSGNEPNVSVHSFDRLHRNVLPDQSIDDNYPLLHTFGNKSEFATFFHKSAEGPPNIVFIIVEALSADFIGKRAAETGNAMPFLDSLRRQGLYFPNFLSVCQNTFNVLPASLSSLPNSSNGEYTMMEEFAPQYSIPMLLPNYYSRFFCGVDLSFTNMDGYMTNIQTDYLVKNWEKKYKVPFSKHHNMWGYPDGFLFQKSWEDYKRQRLEEKPRFDVFLTISSHEPYSFPNDDRYANRNKRRSTQSSVSNKNRKNLYSDNYIMASYNYVDDALRKYFLQASQNKRYKNTIFFIFGDHGCPRYMRNAITRFHVPLVIYSPLLKKSKTFPAVSTQLDLAPTILNYLRLTYNLTIPKKVPFIGKELDFHPAFRNTRSTALLHVNGKNESFLHQHYFYSNGSLYRVQKDLHLTEVFDSKKVAALKHQLRYYDMLSKYCFGQKKILPMEMFKSRMQTYDYRLTFHHFEPSIKSSEKQLILMPPHSLAPNTKALKVLCEFDMYIRSEKDFLEKADNFVTSLVHTKNGREETLIWRKLKMTHIETLKPNAFNRVKVFAELHLQSFGNISTKNRLSLEYLNDGKNSFSMRNIKYLIHQAQ